MGTVTFTGKRKPAEDLANELESVETYFLQLIDDVAALLRLLDRRDHHSEATDF